MGTLVSFYHLIGCVLPWSIASPSTALPAPWVVPATVDFRRVIDEFHTSLYISWGCPIGTSSKESACQCRRHKRYGFDPWVRKIPWRRKWQPAPVWVSESCSVVSYSLQPHDLYSPWNSPGQNTGVGSLSLLQRIFPTQGLNPGLRHWRRILYQLSQKGSPNSGVGSLSLLQQIFPTRESNWGLLHCRRILYQLNYQGSPLQYSCLEDSMDRAAWLATVCRAAKSWTWLKRPGMHARIS